MAACNKETLQILKLTSQGYIILLWNFKFHKSVGIFLYTIQIWLDSIDNFCMHTWLDSISNFCIQIWSVFVSNFCIAYKPDQNLSVICVYLTNLVRFCQLFLYSLQTWSESVCYFCIPYKPGQNLSYFCIPYKPGQNLAVVLYTLQTWSESVSNFVYHTNLVRICQ